MANKKFNLILLGSAGSGKGTQAQMLAQEFKMEILEMGELVRKAGEKKDKKGRLIAWMDKVGMHFPDDFILELFEQKIKRTAQNKNLLIDGYPRTAGQAWDLDRILKKYYKNRPFWAVWLKVSEKEAIRRLLNRSVCTKCGQIFVSRKIKKCPKCGGKVKVRAYDQSRESIKRRLKWFQEHVVPAIEFYSQRKVLIVINGEQLPEKVFKDIIKKIRKKIRAI